MNMNVEKIKNFNLENGEITFVKELNELEIPGAKELGFQLPDVGTFYKVEIRLYPTDESDIRVMLYLPEEKNWNKKFLGTGNGGAAGNIWEGSLLNGIMRGYAVANTNLGTSPDPYECIGKMEVLKDFGYRATHLMTVVGKELTTYFYGKAPEYSYFMGGSTGGQQALSEAQRYPKDYDGIIAISPAHDRIRLHSFFVWNWQQIHKRENAGFTMEQAKKWRDSLVEVYGELCGSNTDDDFLFYPSRIRENPMKNVRMQKYIDEHLNAGQADALKTIYDGAENPLTGEKYIAPFLPGTEPEFLSLPDISQKEEFARGYFFPFYWLWGKDFDFMNFDFEKDLNDAIDILSPIMDATNPDLSEFKECGGKLLVLGGSVDAIIPYTGFVDYYKEVIEKQGGLDVVKEFFRFILLPGYSHTMGGPGVKDIGIFGVADVPKLPEYDLICTIEQWVEKGIAPEKFMGTYFKEDGKTFDYGRPSFIYPYVTEFIGGDVKNPDNYRAVEDAEAYER